MKKALETSAVGGLISSTMTTEEYDALVKRGERILSKVPDKWRSTPRSRTVGELFKNMDQNFAIVASRTRKKSS